jgi:osmotically-inducible protein OsmY
MLATLITALLSLPAQQISDVQIAEWVAHDLSTDARERVQSAEQRLDAVGLRDDLTLAREVGGKVVGAGGRGIVVGVHESEVVLHGRVTDAQQKDKLLALAAGVQGVRAVDDRLVLPGEELPAAKLDRNVPAPNPPAITERFDFLTGDSHAGRGLQVAVDTGIVTLTGEVCSDAAKLYATGLAQRVPGVRAVRNQCSVRISGLRDDQRLALLVARELEYNRLVQNVSPGILVTVHHGVVRLTGRVRDEGQWFIAGEVAATMSAVFAVDNQLVVDEDLVVPSTGRVRGFEIFRGP